MNIQQTRLNNYEITLLKKVLDFSLSIGSSHICFRDITDKVGLDLTIPRKYNEENLGKEQIERLSKRIKELEREIERWEKTRKSIDLLHLSDEERSAIYVTFPWRKRYPAWTIHDYIPLLRDQKSNIERIVDQSRIITPLLGCFNADEQKVNLYTNNIEESNSKRFLPLISTFIHEMFHAWNFFESGRRDKTIRELDEAMVELGTLYFLQEISKTDDVFTQIFEWYKDRVRRKQESIGEEAAYGFGYYLFSLIETKEDRNVKNMLDLYSEKSGHFLINTQRIKTIKSALYPIYPFEEESRVYSLFQETII